MSSAQIIEINAPLKKRLASKRRDVEWPANEGYSDGARSKRTRAPGLSRLRHQTRIALPSQHSRATPLMWPNAGRLGIKRAQADVGVAHERVPWKLSHARRSN